MGFTKADGKWCIENWKQLTGIIMFIISLTGNGLLANDNMEKESQIESGNHAVATLSGLVFDNKEKLVSEHVVTNTTTVIQKDCSVCEKVAKDYYDHARIDHGK